MNQPWLWKWNHSFFEVMFHYLPPRPPTVDWAEALVTNPLLSTWVFAAVFYCYWTKDDGQKTWRRTGLLQTLLALALAVLITLILRPWIHWPAPNLNPEFQALFPRYLWGSGNENCFPSHSTLAYFVVALGFFPLHRQLSLALALASLLLVALPRVYLGGHYPMDVLFSCALAAVALFLVRRWTLPHGLRNWFVMDDRAGAVRTGLLFLWMFELGEGFRGLELMVGLVRHWWFGVR